MAPFKSIFLNLSFFAIATGTSLQPSFAYSTDSAAGAPPAIEAAAREAEANASAKQTSVVPLQTGKVQSTETAVDKARRPKVVLALGGGGTRGLAHIGALRVLQREGIPIDGITGTSMGAIVGGLFAAGLTPDQIEDLMRNKSMVHAYDTVPIPVRLALVPVFGIPHLVGYHPYDGLYKGNKFSTYIETVVPPSKRNIEDFHIPFQAVATDLLEGEPYCIKNGSIGRAIQASSALPGLRRPLPWQGKLLVDGGVLMNLPTIFAKDMGGDVIIAVDVDGVHEKMTEADFHKIGSVTFRCINLHLKAIDAISDSQANVVVRPPVGAIGLLSKRTRDITYAIEQGEKSMEAALPEIRKELARVTVELAAGK